MKNKRLTHIYRPGSIFRTEGDETYIYTGFCGKGDKSRTGAMATMLGADMPTAYGANNHGSIVQIGEDWYIFYHRHTNNTWYSRQGCAVVTCNKISGGRNYAENSTDRKWMGERY